MSDLEPASTLILVAADLEASILFPDPVTRPPQLRVVGVGRGGDAAAADAMEETRPHRVLNVGFAGGLIATSAPGTCIATSAWVGPYAGPAAALPQDLRAALDEGGIQDGLTATVDAPVGNRADRAPLLAAGATLVEMEGGAWARLAAERGIPFAAIRVISDRADNPLPRPRHELLRADGSVRWKQWIDAVKAAASPWPEAHRRLRRARTDWNAATGTLARVGGAISEWLGE